MGGVIRVPTVGPRVGHAVLKGGHTRVGFHGTVQAVGSLAGEDGGSVEVSAARHLVVDGTVDTRAQHGHMGTLLIDPAIVSIGNGPNTPDGSYINAGSLADTLFSSNVTLSATSQVAIVDDISLATSPSFNATTLGSLTLQAPTVSIGGNVSMGEGNVILDGSTLDLAGAFSSGGSALCTAPSSSACTRLTGTATQVNVLGSSANLAQAMSAAASGATVHVSSGTYPGNYNILQPITLIGNLGDPLVPGADANAPLLNGMQTGGTIFSLIGVPNVTIEGFRMSGNVDGVAADNSGTAVDSTACDGLVVTNDSLDGFTLDAMVLFFGSNDSVAYNAFATVGTSTINAVSLTNPNIHDNIIATLPAAPAGNGVSTVVLAGLLLAAGLFASRPRARRPSPRLSQVVPLS